MVLTYLDLDPIIVFRGLPLDLFPSSGIQFMATFAGLTFGCLSTWPANLSLRVFTVLDTDCISDLRINSPFVIIGDAITLLVFSGYIAGGIHLKYSRYELSIFMSHMHDVLSIAQSLSRGRI